MATITVWYLGNEKVAAQPVGYMGEGFQAYLAATKRAGATYDKNLKAQVAPLTSLTTLIANLKEQGFEAHVHEDLKKRVAEHVQEANSERQAAESRISEVEARLKEQGIRVKPFQREGIHWISSRDRLLLSDQMGCVTGDAVIQVNRDGRDFEMTLEDLYRRFHGLAGKWNLQTPTRVTALCHGELRRHRIMNVLDQGVRPVVEVTLESGKKIRLTPDHEVAVPRGRWVAAERLQVGQEVLTDGSEASKKGIRSTPVEDRVVSVSPAGEEHVYDIVCADPHRNFTANGIVVHNCGKTMQVLLALPEQAPVVVVCPAIAKGVWQDEVAKWRPSYKITSLYGRNSFRWPERGEIICVNYDILPPQKEELKVTDTLTTVEQFSLTAPEGLILVADEIHQAKSSKAKRTQRFRVMARAAHRVKGKVWLMTGTPLLNRPPELWCLLQNGGMTKATFGDWNNMVRLFNGVPGRWGGYEWGRPEPEVATVLDRVMLRRRAQDVLNQMDRATIQHQTVEITDKKVMKLADEFVKILEEKGLPLETALEEAMDHGMPAFDQFSRVRAAIATAKVPALMEVVEEYEEEEEPVVVFSAHVAPVQACGAREGWACITGETPNEVRSQIQRDFQAGKLKGVALTIKAGGVAITLTRACHTVFCDMEWVPGLNEQAMFRVDRIGQTRPVHHRILQANHPLDSHISRMLVKKQQLIDASVEAAADTLRDRGTVTFADQSMAEAVSMATPTKEVPDLSGLISKDPKPTTPAPARVRPTLSVRRGPATPQEEWAAAGCLHLDSLDEDRAQEQNDRGFNKIDSGLGASLADQLRKSGELTDKQWQVLVTMLKKYSRQVGKCPE